jgi:hypothetical protein
MPVITAAMLADRVAQDRVPVLDEDHDDLGGRRQQDGGIDLEVDRELPDQQQQRQGQEPQGATPLHQA